MPLGPGEAIVAVTSIVLGIGITALFIVKVTGLIKYWIDSRSGANVSADVNGRISELENFRQRTEKRIQNLETIIVDHDMSLPEPEAENSSLKGEENRALKNKLRK